jgi:DNA ligase-4
MTDTNGPKKKSKAELEQLVKSNGGKIYQTNTAAPRTVCIADRRTVKVASLQKSARDDIIRPNWLLDCIKQNEIDRPLSSYLLPLEPRHMFFTTDERREEIADNVDVYNDSYARDVTPEELRTILDAAKPGKQQLIEYDVEINEISATVFERSHEEGTMPPGWLFRGLAVHFHEFTDSSETSDQIRIFLARKVAEFGGADIVDELDIDSGKSKGRGHISTANIPTHIVATSSKSTKEEVSNIRKTLAQQQMSGRGLKVPHVVTVEWIEQSWKEKTLLDEDCMFFPPFSLICGY